MKNSSKPRSLYIHIPFCKSICGYCDFCKVQYLKNFEMPFLKRLAKEIDSYHIEELDTIYIGGGTPTSLSDEGFEYLFKMISKYTKGIKEFSVETNPETLTLSKIKTMKEYGVNRVSIGVESTYLKYLDLMNRHHTFDDVKTVYALLKENGIYNVNFDLMIGLPNQTIKMIKKDLEDFVLLDPKHISVYSLTVHPNTIFSLKGIKEVNDVISRKQMDAVVTYLASMGYRQYEISNFSLTGYESIHNKVYWKNERYYGVGLGASGYIDNIRYTNTRSMNDYIEKEDIIVDKEIVTKEDDIEYFLMLNLRLADGFSDDDFMNRYGFSFKKKYLSKIKKAISNGWLIVNENIIRPTYEGMMLLDRLILLLLE